MLIANISFSGIISGFILMLCASCVLFFFFLNYIIRIKKIKKIKVEKKYFNKKLNLFFILFLNLFLLPFLLALIIFFVFILKNKENNSLKLAYILLYLTYICFVLFYIIYLNINVNSQIVWIYENKLILFNEFISLSSIKEIKRNVKRTVIYLTVVDEKNLEDIIKIKYHWKLFDFFKTLNLNVID